MANLALLPSHIDLLAMDLELAARFGAKSTKGIGLLKELIDKYLRSEFDVILCDCPPNLNLITQNAIVASDAIIIVALPEYLSVVGIDWIIKAKEELISRINKELEPFGAPIFRGPAIAGIIFNRVREGTLLHGYKQRQIHERYSSQGIHVFDSYLSESVRIGERPEMKLPIALSEWRIDAKYRDQLEAIITEFIDHAYK